MLLSEILEWQWAITWDNAMPTRNSTKLLSALGMLGRVTKTETKTTVIFSPKMGISYRQIRTTITDNLDPKNGGVTYVNLRTGKAWEWGPGTANAWQKAN